MAGIAAQHVRDAAKGRVTRSILRPCWSLWTDIEMCSGGGACVRHYRGEARRRTHAKRRVDRVNLEPE